jgi:transposase-like protein
MKAIVNKKGTAVKCPGCKAINRVKVRDRATFTCTECWTDWILLAYKEMTDGKKKKKG